MLGDRTRFVLCLSLGWLLIGAVLRAALIIHHQPGHAVAAWCLGLVADGLVGVVLASLVSLILALSGGGSLARTWWRITVQTALGSGMVFLAFVEWFFVAEFDARFNHIALDYVLYPHEVVTNIGESYNLPLFTALALAGGSLMAWLCQRWLRGATFAPLRWPMRLVGAAGSLVACAMAVLVLCLWPADPFADRLAAELSANGLVQLARAAATAKLPYALYYRTLPQDQAERLARQDFGWDNATAPSKHLMPTHHRDRPLDVIVVLEESLGSEFSKRLGGKRDCTPGLDRWAEKGLLLTNLVPTGNRTVRGLEGVLDSFIPLPGDSIWKRPNPEGTASLAGVFKRAGYDTVFCYGGAGIFDGMKSFATATGWDRFVEDGLIGSAFPKDALRTAWGVADEFLFAAVLDEQRAAKRSGKPLFATVLTVSNHKPFLTPASIDPRRSTSNLIRWGLIGVGLVTALVMLWITARQRIGRVRLAVLGGILLTAYGVYASVKFQPKDSRTNAVKYADRALTAWLDQAEQEGLLEHTIVLIVGDHGARVYGSAEIPAASYRVPGLFISPDASLRGTTIDRLCSQVDLAPTLLSLAGIEATVPFCGSDLLRLDANGPGRAWLIHNRNIGLLTDDRLIVLGLEKSTQTYRRSDRSSDTFAVIPASDLSPADHDLSEHAAADYQMLEHAYEQHAYTLPAP